MLLRRVLFVVMSIFTVGVVLTGCATVLADEPNNESLFPEVADSSHATEKAAAFFHSFFTAKSQHNVDETMEHFSQEKLTYIDATLGWLFDSHGALKGVFDQYMPQWPETGLSYATRIIGDENSALVAFTDTPELFGSEIRILASIDMQDGKVIRWVDYWDGRHFGAELAAQMRTPSEHFPTDFMEATVDGSASAKISEVANSLQDAITNNDAQAAAELFSYDAVYEDMTLRTQVLGSIAIERYLGRMLAEVPYGVGSTLSHVVGAEMGGGYEWKSSPAYSATVKHGVTALELDEDGKISRLTTVWDGAMISDEEMKTLMVLSLETAPVSDIPEITIEAADFSFDAPDQIEAGLVKVNLVNNGHEPHHAQLVRLNEGVTLEQFQAALPQGDAVAFPLVTFVGGPDLIDPGLNSQVTLDVTPGQYVLLCFIPGHDGVPHLAKGMVRPMEVVAATDHVESEKIKADATIKLLDFSFILPTEIKAGPQVWEVVNEGPQLHEIMIVRLAEGKTTDDIQAFMQAPHGTPPFSQIGGLQAITLGESGWLNLDLTPGEYVALCHVPGPASGHAHLALGMIMPFSVK